MRPRRKTIEQYSNEQTNTIVFLGILCVVLSLLSITLVVLKSHQANVFEKELQTVKKKHRDLEREYIVLQKSFETEARNHKKDLERELERANRHAADIDLFFERLNEQKQTLIECEEHLKNCIK